VSATSLEAFIVRLYRESNSAGFLKAFSDEPEAITSGLSPLKAIMHELRLRTVHIYPRFHDAVKAALERRRADVVELFQPLTPLMADMHTALVQCMGSTLAELTRSNAGLDLDALTLENAYFRAFDALVRRQLDPVWHKVGPKTKQLVSDLGTLRRLLSCVPPSGIWPDTDEPRRYLLTYDPLAFHAYLETLVAASTAGPARQHVSPWLLTDAANTLFTCAKRRCYTLSRPGADAAPAVDEEGWAALAEHEGRTPAPEPARPGKRPKWLPQGMEPTLEEPPKWSLLADVLKEIEEEMLRQDALPRAGSPPFLPARPS
jgi:DNA excision repair protein ERCC-4